MLWLWILICYCFGFSLFFFFNTAKNPGSIKTENWHFLWVLAFCTWANIEYVLFTWKVKLKISSCKGFGFWGAVVLCHLFAFQSANGLDVTLAAGWWTRPDLLGQLQLPHLTEVSEEKWQTRVMGGKGKSATFCSCSLLWLQVIGDGVLQNLMDVYLGWEFFMLQLVKAHASFS